MDSPHSSQSEEVPIYNKTANHYTMRRRPAAPSGEAGTSP
ncbi:hypothetical protein QFZ25_001263 [Bacillus atrophaeus]|jgi:hypothetical protein|nr:hypothetical protein S101359_01402 [Bacillus atrophaeus]MDQ0927203.1 hypothetical protein [Bacillus atrophaeus]